MDKHWITDEWQGCYPSNWKGVVVAEAMSHPAKFSSKLVRRMYAHLFEMGWVKPGNTVLDPFGGVALGALEAMRNGLRWRGVELEPKFQEIGAANIALWNRKFGQMPRWSGSAILFQGDSRRLLEIVGQEFSGDLAVSSPPYADGAKHTGGEDTNPDKIQGGKLGTYGANYGDTPGQLGEMKSDNFDAALSSPPYAVTDLRYKKNGLVMEDGKPYERPYMEGQGEESYGGEPGQLGGMKGDGFQAVISSPPFRHSEGGTPEPKPGGTIDDRLYQRHAAGNSAAEGYGATEGQLANMPEGDFQGVVSSPPFRDNLAAEFMDAKSRRELARSKGISNAEHISPIDMEAIGGREQKDARYGATEGQLANMPEGDFQGVVSSPPYESTRVATGEMQRGDISNIPEFIDTYGAGSVRRDQESVDDFWLAARQIVEQVYLALEPGGHACWVVKDFVRNKEISPFADQWRQLCEAVGFVTVHEHRAMLVHKKGKSYTLDGETVTHQTESKSFFRRLAEKKGSPRIDWETIWCMEKPR